MWERGKGGGWGARIGSSLKYFLKILGTEIDHQHG